MPFTIDGLVLFVIAVAFVFLVVYLVKLSNAAQVTLKNLDEALSDSRAAINSTLTEIKPVLSRLTEVEDTTQKTLSGINQRLSLIETELVPLLKEFRDTNQVYQGLERALEKGLDEEVHPVLENVYQITDDVQGISGNLKTRVEQTQNFFEAVHEAGETVQIVTEVTRSGLSGLAVQMASMAVGIKTSLEFLSENLIKGGSK
ncbi:MAG: hypothetical protein GWP10_00175 [Nitrospiraceae bacterium]|nr:hypothetical protein [Nitrospiraceae bacterium]